MGSTPGHIELERATDSIWAGNRHRQDLGDLDPLTASIDREGLLQPITITPDGMLICGVRRLAAIKRLGWKTVNVWVRSGISTRLGQLLAEQDDNVLHKPLTQTEQAALYRELKVLLAEDATRRQEASRFTAGGQNPRSDGAADSAAPSTASGDAREQAALLITGRKAYSRLEETGRLQAIAGDPAQPEPVRVQAAAELEAITAGGPVHPGLQRVNARLALSELDQLATDQAQPAGIRQQAAAGAARVRELEATVHAADLERLAAQALRRAKAATKKRKHPIPGAQRRLDDGEPVLLPLRSFLYLWDDLGGWWNRYDAAQIGAALTDWQWEQFLATLAGTTAFAQAARTAREQATPTVATG
ncbi:ParB N-terminal domain-containing protein [Rathayibacter soli]|uniref:ParB N-terminal domain-containing protein n=1 Tax=Rathayibacter soli TaxID=3144168 RepID=UPI0027E4902E|nr:ParB N-terminal domain-containing protein [Glaciibacter superstes]